MKTACFLFTIIGFGALTLGVSLADQPSGQPSGPGPEKKETTSDRPANQMRGKQKGLNEEQADTLHHGLGESGGASKKSSQTGPIKKVILPAHRPDHDHPKQVTDNHGYAGEKRVDNPQSKLPSVNSFHQPGLNHPSTAVAKDELTINRTANPQEELTKRLPVGNGANASLPGVVHSGGAGTPINGQLTLSRAKTSTAVLNGTGMRHKP
jgi:hypothetical protein